jgi:hypothetical protein
MQHFLLNKLSSPDDVHSFTMDPLKVRDINFLDRKQICCQTNKYFVENEKEFLVLLKRCVGVSKINIIIHFTNNFQ